MTWTAIFRKHDDSAFSTKIIHGIWNKREAIEYAEKELGRKVLAIIAGVQTIHFNDSY